MFDARPYTCVLERLKNAELRPTRQRLALAKLLLEEGDRHVTAEQLHCEAADAGIKVSLATVYNTLHQFTKAKLLCEVVVESGRAYFDTNTDAHYHIFHQDTGELCDILDDAVSTLALPDLPAGTEIDRVDVIVRVKKKIQ
jgi:Fur family iron response transcriptional regulator